MSELIDKMREASKGEEVWHLMAEDGKGYMDRFTIEDGGKHAGERYLKEQQEKGYMQGCFIREGRARNELHRLLEEGADQLTAAQARVAGHIEHIKSLEAEVAELRAIKFKRFSSQDYWIYQGDGSDHLESLVCPVVMSAQQVMEFEKTQARVAKLLESLADHKQVIADKRERIQELKADNARLTERVAELDEALRNAVVRGLESEKNLAKALELEHKAERLTADNARLLDDNVRIALERDSLRELLRECLEYLPLRGHTYNAMACQDRKLGDRIKAATEKGE